MPENGRRKNCRTITARPGFQKARPCPFYPCRGIYGCCRLRKPSARQPACRLSLCIPHGLLPGHATVRLRGFAALRLIAAATVPAPAMAVSAVTRPTIAFAAPGGVVVIGRCRLRDCDPGIFGSRRTPFPVVAAFAPCAFALVCASAPTASAVRTAAATASATATAPTAVIDGRIVYGGPRPRWPAIRPCGYPSR